MGCQKVEDNQQENIAMAQSKLIKRGETLVTASPKNRNRKGKSMHVTLKDWVTQHQNTQATNVRAAFRALFVPNTNSEKTAPDNPR